MVRLYPAARFPGPAAPRGSEKVVGPGHPSPGWPARQQSRAAACRWLPRVFEQGGEMEEGVGTAGRGGDNTEAFTVSTDWYGLMAAGPPLANGR